MIAAFQLKRAVALPVEHSGVYRISVTNPLSSSGLASCTWYWSHLPESNLAYTTTMINHGQNQISHMKICGVSTNVIATRGKFKSEHYLTHV